MKKLLILFITTLALSISAMESDSEKKLSLAIQHTELENVELLLKKYKYSQDFINDKLDSNEYYIDNFQNQLDLLNKLLNIYKQSSLKEEPTHHEIIITQRQIQEIEENIKRQKLIGTILNEDTDTDFDE